MTTARRSSLRVFLTGSEGVGKTSCIEALAPRLADGLRVLVPDPETPRLFEAGTPRPLLGSGWSRAHRRARAAAERFRVHAAFLVANFALRVLLARWFEARLRPDVSLYDGDWLIHPLAYARYHFPPARGLPLRPALRIAAAILGVGRDAVWFHLDRPAAAVAGRIEARQEVHAGPQRDLGRVAAELGRVRAAADALGYASFRIEAGDRDPADLAALLEARLRERAL